MKILTLSLSHDSALAYFNTDTKELKYIELDKYTKIKYYKPINEYLSTNTKNIQFILYLEKILKMYNINEIGVMVVDSYEDISLAKMCGYWCISKKIARECIWQYNHNLNHVLPSILATNKDCLALDIEGMGNFDTSTKLYSFIHNKIDTVYQIKNFSYGYLYRIIGYLILSQILNKTLSIRDDSIPGKFMAICGASTNYIKHIGADIYDMIQHNILNEIDSKNNTNNNIYSYIEKCLKNNNIYDVSHTFQEAWIQSILNMIKTHKGKHKRFIISGGCALNCQLNYELYKANIFDEIIWNPISNDSGQSLGILYYYLWKHNLPIPPSSYLSNYDFGTPVYDYNKSIKLNYQEAEISKIVDALVNNKLVGVIRGNIEIGPRALGRRSILANPLYKVNKDHLNNTIKNREWFRPYGIIIPREYLSSYYDLDLDCKYMNIVGYNKTNIPQAVIHYDNTTRIQTVTKESDAWLYELLIEFGNRTGCPMLINTSFNGKGYPIYNWFDDIYSFYNKKLDMLIIDNNMLIK